MSACFPLQAFALTMLAAGQEDEELDATLAVFFESEFGEVCPAPAAPRRAIRPGRFPCCEAQQNLRREHARCGGAMRPMKRAHGLCLSECRKHLSKSAAAPRATRSELDDRNRRAEAASLCACAARHALGQRVRLARAVLQARNRT
jgi:hypothetical protein